MGKITIKPDCGNAPRKKFLAALYTSMANGRAKELGVVVPAEICWEQAGSVPIMGKDEFLNQLRRHPVWKARGLQLDSIITHGPEAAVSGTITASSKSTYAFCDVFTFAGAGGSTIKELKSFLVQIAAP